MTLKEFFQPVLKVQMGQTKRPHRGGERAHRAVGASAG
jgi:hypothetical protein